MNQFELEMKKVAQERDAELLRLDSNMNGIRRDCDRRLTEIQERYQHWLENREKTEGDEKI